MNIFRTNLTKSSDVFMSIISMYKEIRRKAHKTMRKTISYKVT